MARPVGPPRVRTSWPRAGRIDREISERTGTGTGSPVHPQGLHRRIGRPSFAGGGGAAVRPTTGDRSGATTFVLTVTCVTSLAGWPGPARTLRALINLQAASRKLTGLALATTPRRGAVCCPGDRAPGTVRAAGRVASLSRALRTTPFSFAAKHTALHCTSAADHRPAARC